MDSGRKRSLRSIFFAFCYLMLLIVAVTILRALRDVLFLQGIGSEGLPLVFLTTTVVSVAATSGYVHLAKNRSPVWIACSSIVLFGSVLGATYSGLSQAGWLRYAFYVQVAVFNTFAVLQFWALVSELWSPAALERNLPLVGAGGLIGGIVGGLVVTWLSRYSDSTLFWSAVAVMVPLIPLGCGIGTGKGDSTTRVQQEPSFTGLGGCYSEIISNRYYLVLSVLTLVSAVSIVFVDFQFKRSIDIAVSGQNEMTWLFGLFFTLSSGVALLVQVFLLPLLLRRFQPHNLVFALPCSLLLFSAWILFSPALLPALLLKGSEGVFRHTLDRAGMELFYAPATDADRYSLKVAIEGGLARTGELVGGLLLVAVGAGVAVGDQIVPSLLVVGAGTWLCLSLRMKNLYSEVLLRWLSEFAAALSFETRSRIQHWMYDFARERAKAERDSLCNDILAKTGLLCRPDWCREFQALARSYPAEVVIPCYWGWISPRTTPRRFAFLVLKNLGQPSLVP